MLLAAAQAHGAWPIAAAAGIGLLLGLERERRKVHAGHKGTAGVRTFTLVALLGALAARTGDTAILAVACGFVGAAALVGYWRVGDPGLTTEVALVVAFLLGALAQDDVELAAAIGVGVTLLLAERTRLQHLARDVLTEEELHDGLLLAACAVIVLPLLPDHGIGPGDALNPVTVWRLVVVLMVINALGYIALRVLGTRRGLPLAGFVGGFVSSPATIAAMGMRARREPEISRGAVAAAVASTVATSVLTGIVVAVADTHVLAAVSLALVFAAVTALMVALAAARRVPDSQDDDAGRLAYGRAFDIKAPLVLAGTISLVLAGAHVLQSALGTSGALIAIALGVAIALSTNTVSKAIAALAFKRPGEIARVWWGLAAVLAATWVGLAVGAGLGL